MKRCQWCSVVALALVFAGAGSVVESVSGADGPRADAAGKPDKDRLQGKWLLVAGETNGKPFRKEMLDRRLTVVVVGDKWDQFIGEETKPDSWSFTTDAAKSPKQIDFTDLSPDAKGDEKKMVGIYELDGDKLRVCNRRPGVINRPAEFRSADKDTVIRIYERMK